mmetsp:Transcript_12555/g.31891  ORF Transcript_12555/g.31891 Transcript_12555/m.31891 type:complete len:330 (+) Transcript_12555:2602-3591(+)
MRRAAAGLTRARFARAMRLRPANKASVQAPSARQASDTRALANCQSVRSVVHVSAHVLCIAMVMLHSARGSSTVGTASAGQASAQTSNSRPRASTADPSALPPSSSDAAPSPLSHSSSGPIPISGGECGRSDDRGGWACGASSALLQASGVSPGTRSPPPRTGGALCTHAMSGTCMPWNMAGIRNCAQCVYSRNALCAIFGRVVRYSERSWTHKACSGPNASGGSGSNAVRSSKHKGVYSASHSSTWRNSDSSAWIHKTCSAVAASALGVRVVRARQVTHAHESSRRHWDDVTESLLLGMYSASSGDSIQSSACFPQSRKDWAWSTSSL